MQKDVAKNTTKSTIKSVTERATIHTITMKKESIDE